MAGKNQRAQNLAYDWLKWLSTRRFFGPPPQKHILALMQQQGLSGETLDAPLSIEMPAFHNAVNALPDNHGRPFLKIYCGFPEGVPVKTLAYSEGIGLRTYYDRAEKAASDVLKQMNHNLVMVETLKLMRAAA